MKLLGVYNLNENVYDEETAMPYQALAKPAYHSFEQIFYRGTRLVSRAAHAAT